MPDPKGQRNQGFGSTPVISRIVSSARLMSRRSHSSVKASIGAWKFEWLPIRWPASTMLRAISGFARVQRPWRKKVARIPAAARVSRIRPSAPGAVGRPGNSVSKVSATRTTAPA